MACMPCVLCTMHFHNCAGEGHDASPMYGDASGNLAPLSSCDPGLSTLLGPLNQEIQLRRTLLPLHDTPKY